MIRQFDAEAIRLLADILNETGLTEIEVAEKDSRIRVVRAPAAVQYAPTPVASVAPAGTPAPAPVHDAPAPPDLALLAGAVKSPMVGVAYLGPEPNAAPFITLGQTVALGQTLMLIEAMKTFNQIKAPRAGRVTHILATSATPVEYGEVLMVID